MAHDGSIASQMEDWLIAQLQAIQFSGAPVFNAEDVQPWGGGQRPAKEDFAAELFSGGRAFVARVFYADEQVTYLDGVNYMTTPRWVIAVGIRSYRSNAEARRGDVPVTGTARPGTNALRALVRYAVEGLKPQNPPGTVITDGVSTVNKVRVLSAELVTEENNQMVLAIYVTVDQV